MDKLKLSQLGERLKTGGAQMGRLVSDKMKEILQTPTPESKVVDEATMETMEEPNWGLNLRICAMINGEQLSGTEIVRAIKRKIGGKSVVGQRLSLDLLEACTMNCEKVFSEVASEKVLDEMVKMIEDVRTDVGNRGRALQLIRGWGESADLDYLPVFRQTYMSLKRRDQPPRVDDGSSPAMEHSLESYVHQDLLSPPENYPVPDMGMHLPDQSTSMYHGRLSAEENNEFIVTAQNSLEVLSSILNADTEPKPIKEDLTVSLFEKCKQMQPVIQRIIQNTVDDEAQLFEALNLNDELQKVISRYEELEAGLKSGDETLGTSSNPQACMPENNVADSKSARQLPETSANTPADFPAQDGIPYETKTSSYPQAFVPENNVADSKSPRKLPETSANTPADFPAQDMLQCETKTTDSPRGESSKSSSNKRIDEPEVAV